MTRVFGRRVGFGLVAALWLLAASCQEKLEPAAGSESHFLETCAATCGEGFECLCGVCTQQCAGDGACAPLFPSATCVDVATRPPASACPGSAATAFCDVRCTTDAECAGLGQGFGCEAGFCRESSGDDLFPNGRIEVDQLCAFYTRHVCRAKLECFGWIYRDLDDCMAAQECSGWELFQRELGEGSISYDPTAAFACHQRLEQDACGLGLMLAVPALSEALKACGALTGHASQDEACVNSAECAAGLSCDRSATCPGSCTSKPVSTPLGSVPLGGACTPTICIDLDDDPSNDVARCEQCQVGLTCYQGACRNDWVLGESCADAAACWPELWCDTDQGKCVPRAAAGEACDGSGFKAPFCVEGYFCSAPNLSIGTCLPESGTGGPCQDQYDCLDSRQRCIPAEDASMPGECGPPAPSGRACRYAEDCATAFCAADRHCREPALGAACTDHCGQGFDCVDGACVSQRFAGDACGATDQCEQSLCRGGLCVRAARIGEGCVSAEDCRSNRCTAGRCADAAECPAP